MEFLSKAAKSLVKRNIHTAPMAQPLLRPGGVQDCRPRQAWSF